MADNTTQIVVLIGGLNSRGVGTDREWSVREDFALVREAIIRRMPGVRFITFSYRSAGPDGWCGGDWDQDADPDYVAADTTDRPLEYQVRNLARLLEAIENRYPDAAISLVGFSLGGLIASACIGSDEFQVRPARLALISTPIGGLTPLAGLVTIPAVAAALRQFDVDFASRAVFADIQTGSSWLNLARLGMMGVPTFAIENSSDYVVNGRRICGQLVFPEWVRTISLGRGVRLSTALPDGNCLWADLGGRDREIRQTHHRILRSSSFSVRAAHEWLADRIADPGLLVAAKRTFQGEPWPLIIRGAFA